jgi:glycosyltransferase involved in cell wall biosynthesis
MAEKERVIANYTGYGILDKDRNSNGVNNLIQEAAQRLKSKGYRTILMGPLVEGKEKDNVADVTLGKAVKVPRAISKRYGTSYPITLRYNKEIATEVFNRTRPDFFVADEPLLVGLGVHTIMSGMPRREDGKPIPVPIGRFHARFKWDIWVATYKALGKAARRPKFDQNGFPIGFTDGPYNTVIKDLYGTAVSVVTRDFVKEHYGIDCEVIPNGIDTDQFTPKGPIKEDWDEQRKKDGKKIIFSSGRIEGRKGQEYLVEACLKLKLAGHKFILYLGGEEGVNRSQLERMVDKKGLKEYVVFVGNLPWEEYLKALRTADVCVYPATGNEGFGRAPVEAVASGNIAVVSLIDGYNEAMEGVPFVLRAKPKDSDDLAEKIKEGFAVADDKRREFGQLNHDYIDKRFGWEVTLDKLDRFFDERFQRHGGVDWSKLPQSETLYTKKGEKD